MISKIKLGFDATFATSSHRGMGRYVRQLVKPFGANVLGFSKCNLKVIYGCTGDLYLSGREPIPIWEQLRLPLITKGINLDYLLCGYNTAPIFFKTPKIILVVHDLIFFTNAFNIFEFHSIPQKIGIIYRRIIVPRAIKRASKIITVSEVSRRKICEKFSLDESRVTVLPNSIPDDWFDVRNDMLPLPRIRPYIFTVSGSVPSKNLETLIKAFNLCVVDDSLSELDLRIVGLNEWEIYRYTSLVESLGIADRVIFYKSVESDYLQRLYVSSSIFVSASIDEGFGIPVLEAMSLEVPIVCSDIPVYHEIASTYVDYFNPFSMDDIKDKIVKNFNYPPSSSELTAAKEHARRYSSSNCEALAIDFFKSLI